MRITITDDPYASLDTGKDWADCGWWPCKWIGCPEAGRPPFVTAYRRRFSLDASAKIRVHVSADERYELFLDGQSIGRGSERGDRECWFYESYDLDLAAGEHVIVARVWSLGDRAAFAQMTARPGFILSPDVEHVELLGTGVAEWEAKKLGGYSFTDPRPAWGTGANVIVDGAAFPWGFETSAGEGWGPAEVLHEGTSAASWNEAREIQKLTPATLGPMMDQEFLAGTARFVSDESSDDTKTIAVRSEDNIPSELDQWNLIKTGGSAIVPANTSRRVIVDLDGYYCAYPEVTTSGGKGSSIRLRWAEALYDSFESYGYKGNRDEIEGKFFWGTGDTFRPDGGKSRKFNTLWFQAGRYLELMVHTADEPLTIESIKLRETRFPLEMESSFEASDPRLGAVVPMMVRGLQMCSHETYFDCPYYEQLMYVGDTRLQVLITYVLSHDYRLPRKAITTFDNSRRISGLTQSRYPSRVTQIIPPFSLWWIGMVHDLAFWRDDPALVSEMMVGVRGVIDRYLQFANSDGLIQGRNGWNFVDWVPEWGGWGIAPDANRGVNGTINWQFVMTLGLVAELEDLMGEPELAARARRMASEFAERATKVFWDESRGLLAQDIAKQSFSEHTQCIALLGGQLDAAKRERVAKSLLEDPSISRTTIFYDHYLFETYRSLGRIDALINRLGLWFDLEKNGLKTTTEMPEPSRSDCHAWGAHPLYHYFASILGIRPGSPGFATVRIEPHLGPLQWAKGRMPHPKGWISADMVAEAGQVKGTIELPNGVTGQLVLRSGIRDLAPGKNIL